jgi:hypothetical protein
MKVIPVFASIGLLVYGLFTRTVEFVVAGVIGIGILATSAILSDWLQEVRGKKKLDAFSRRSGCAIIEGPGVSLEIPSVFSNDFGKIPFSGVSRMIRVNDRFRIFENSYSLYYSAPQYRMAVATSASGNMEHHLCFLLEIDRVNGYHRITQKVPLARSLRRAYTWTVGSTLREYISNNPDIDSHWIIRTDDSAEAQRISSSLYPALAGLNPLFPKNSFVTIDASPTNLDVHITAKYILARTTLTFAEKMEEITECLLKAQRALSE